MALLCCHTSRGKSPPSVGMTAPVLGRALGGVPVAWTLNSLVHGKGLTYLDASPHISFTLSFSNEKEMEGKPLEGFLTLPAVRKVMVKLTRAVLGDVPKPTEASSLVLPLNLSAVAL